MTIQKVTPERVKKFKSDVVGACRSLVTLQEQRIVRGIPEIAFENAFKTVFNGDNSLARDVLYNRFERINYEEAEEEVKAISTVPAAVDMLSSAIQSKTPSLLIVDADNDGIAAASVGMELKRATSLPLFIQTRDYDPQNHGFSIKQINDWLIDMEMEPDASFTVIVTDLGTNQRDTQDSFLEIYPNAKLLIVDHHEPHLDEMVQQHERSVWVSPYVQGSFELSMKGGGGASGGYLLSMLAVTTIQNLNQIGELEFDGIELENRLAPIKVMGKAANVLDRVECDIRLKFLVEQDIKKVFDVASLTGAGRSVGLWVQPIQEESINGLTDLIGKEAVNELQHKRMRLVEQNHLARSLHEALPIMFDEDAPADLDVANLIIQNLNAIPVEDSQKTNHVERIRPYIFNFNYENQLDSKLKKRWLEIATRCMRDISKVEREIIETLRDYELVKEISSDHTLVTQASSPAVHKVFTGRQIKLAYFSTTKPLTMTVRSTGKNHIVMSATSEYPVRELLDGLDKDFPYATHSFRGHSHIGGLTLTVKPGVEMGVMLKAFSQHMNEKIVKIKEQEPVNNAFYVTPFHLSIVREILQKMRVHLEPKSAPTLLMKIDEGMTFEDKYTLEKKTVSDLVQERSWATTSEPLDFSGETALLIPNQALKMSFNDDFNGALGIRLLENGNYLVDKMFTGVQLEGLELPVLTTPQQKHRDSLEVEYKKHFGNKKVPLVQVPRQVAVDAIKFAHNPESIYRDTEAVISEVIRVMEADSFVVLDVEADGAGNAQCFNVGLYIFKPSAEEPGKMISNKDFESLLKSDPNSVRNYAFIDDGKVLVNQGLDMSIASVIIGMDGPQPIRISLKVQNLTSMDQPLLDNVGCTAEEAQEKLMSILEGSGKFIIQAHNLPYDDNIMRVNFPKVYDLMSEMIHLDSAIPAKNHQIAYSNLSVNTIEGDDYYNAVHEGFNLSTLLKTKESFNYPSLKGNTILQVRGDVVQKFDLKTRITTRLKVSRADLEASLTDNMSPIRYPKYGIEKLLKVATIHDMISHQPVKQTQYVEFNGFGMMSIDEKLWRHFQDNYAYDRSPEENVLMFMRLPEVMDIIESPTFKVDDFNKVDHRLVEARGLGSGNKYDPNKKEKTDKAQAAREAMMSTFSSEDVLKANAIEFARMNPENVERFARSWVYELVLDHHEITRKDPPKSFIQGVAEMTGLDFDIVKLCYDEAYMYKEFRGIKSMFVEETHNNVTLEGDTFQECLVVMHMLTNKLGNPFAKGEVAMRNRVTPYQAVVDALRKQAAESSLKNVIRVTSNIVTDSDVLNNYSARQLDNFSDEGISFKGMRAGTPKMKCKTLSASGADVHVEFPDVDAEKFRAMSAEERQNLESRVEVAVTTLVLSNSREEKSLSPGVKHILNELVTNSYLVGNLTSLQKQLGKMIPTQKESLLKDMMKGAVAAILGNSELKMPTNKEIPGEDLDVAFEALKKGVEFLATQQNFESYIPIEEIEERFTQAKYEYRALQEALKSGERVDEVAGYGPLSTPAKSMQTRVLKAQGNVLQELSDACEDLALGVLTKKKDPAMFLLNSSLNIQVMGRESVTYAPVLKDVVFDTRKEGESPSSKVESNYVKDALDSPNVPVEESESPVEALPERERREEEQLGLDFGGSARPRVR